LKLILNANIIVNVISRPKIAFREILVELFE
jgi:hypothetical protein